MNIEKPLNNLILEDGSVFKGKSFGFPASVAGEVVFNTGMVGYPETLTDPSYKGQILVLTYPLIGNYGIPDHHIVDGIDYSFESEKIQIAGLIISEISLNHSHWSSVKSLTQWLNEEKIPALSGIDTRALTKRLREKGSMPGKIISADQDVEFYDPNEENLVPLVSVKEPVYYQKGKKRVLLIDCGCKNSIIRNLTDRNLSVLRVPWDYDFSHEDFDGILISNGPGDPKMCNKTILHVREAMEKNNHPIFGICLGNQLMALAAHSDTYKLKYGHRSQNQPCIEAGTRRCMITSQNHGYAINDRSLPGDWRPWFVNANDGTNEGIRHSYKPFRSIQFHPEAAPGPVDANYLFDEFSKML